MRDRRRLACALLFFMLLVLLPLVLASGTVVADQGVAHDTARWIPWDNPARPPVAPMPPLPTLSTAEALVVEQLAEAPCHIDDLVSRCRLTPGELSVMLLRLELRGVVQQLPGKYFAFS